MLPNKPNAGRALLLAVGLAWAVWAGAAEKPAKPNATGDAKVRNLLQERLTVLKQIADELQTAYQDTGSVPLETVLQAQMTALKAELELSQSSKDRIAILEKILDRARRNEKNMAKRYENGRVRNSACLTAVVNRLDAQIALERARLAAKTTSK